MKRRRAGLQNRVFSEAKFNAGSAVWAQDQRAAIRAAVEMTPTNPGMQPTVFGRSSQQALHRFNS